MHITLNLQQVEFGGTAELETRHTGRAVSRRYSVVRALSISHLTESEGQRELDFPQREGEILVLVTSPGAQIPEQSSTELLS